MAELETTLPANQVSEPLINVVDPDTGEVGSLPESQAREALKSGYTEASPEEVSTYLDQKKYGSPAQQAITGLESAAKNTTFGLSTGAERALGVPPEDILKREQINPGASFIGGTAGLLGSMATGVGEGALAEKAGELGANALGLGLENAGVISKIGSKAVQSAIAFGGIQGGDEISHMLASDPEQSVGTAIQNMGLATVIGGAMGAGFGAVPPLWNSTMGGKLGMLLDAVKKRVNGEDIAGDAIKTAINTTGVDLDPAIKSALSDNPEVREMASVLSQSDSTKAGLDFQGRLGEFRSQISSKFGEWFGKSPEDLEALKDLSANQVGKDVQDSIKQEVEARFKPYEESYNEIQNKFKHVELPKDQRVVETVPGDNPYMSSQQITKNIPGFASSLKKQIYNTMNEMGVTKLPGSSQESFGMKAINGLDKVKTLEDLRQISSALKNEARGDFSLSYLNGKIQGILSDGSTDILSKAVGAESPELVQKLQIANQSYKASRELLENLNDRLHMGRFGGVGSFVDNLEAMKPEQILSRLNPKNDADLINLLKTKLPGTYEKVKDFQLNQLMKKSSPKGEFNVSKFLKEFEKSSPEVKGLLSDGETQQKVSAISQILDRLEDSKHNYSNTARTIDKTMSSLSSAAATIHSLANGHNPLEAGIIGQSIKWLGRDVPDAFRLGMLNFLGSSADIHPEAFKTMVDFIHSVKQGDSALTRGVQNIFKSGAEIYPQVSPDKKKLEKLNMYLEKAQANPERLLNVGGTLAHYLPHQGTSLAETAGRAVMYLNSLRPSEDKQRPLDKAPVVSASQKADYENALAIAEQPAVVLQHIKEGTISPRDLVHLNNIYPGLYQGLKQKIVGEIVEAEHEERAIPYHLKQSLSVFLGEPLDSTMTPQGIVGAQMTFQQNLSPTQKAPDARGGNAHSMKALSKISEIDQTPSQARQMSRSQAR